MRYTPAGTAVTNFSVAVNDNYTNNAGEKVERTIWVRITAWGKQAENCNQYLKKGKKVLVEGRLIVDPATGGPKVYDKNDGTKGASFEVSASTVHFLSARSESDTEAPEEATSESTSGDIPF
jgi:single-strand DNA-binding protein